MSGVSEYSGVTIGEGVSQNPHPGILDLEPDDLTRGLWFDITDAATLSLSGSNIISVTDKKQGLVATQATDAKRPVLAANQINGKSAAQFRDGSNQWLGASNVPFATYYTSGDFTSIHIFNAVGSGAQSGMLMGFGTGLGNIMSQLMPFIALGNMYFDYGNASTTGRIFGTTPVDFFTVYNIVTCRFRASDKYAELRVNGTLIASGTLVDTWEPGTVAFEIGRITGVDTYQSNMDWCESILPDQYLTDAQMNNIANGYLSDKYALSWNNI